MDRSGSGTCSRCCLIMPKQGVALSVMSSAGSRHKQILAILLNGSKTLNTVQNEKTRRPCLVFSVHSRLIRAESHISFDPCEQLLKAEHAGFV